MKEQIEKLEQERKELIDLASEKLKEINALKIQAFKDKWGIEVGDVITDGRKTGKIKSFCIMYGEVNALISLAKKDGSYGLRTDRISGYTREITKI